MKVKVFEVYKSIVTLFWWIILWTSLGALVWVYVAYPLLLGLVAFRRRPTIPEPIDLPSVSLILAVYNEARVLRRKLENCLALDYPAKSLEYIIVSDGSPDETDAILREFERSGFRVLLSGARIGKTGAQNQAVALARNEILFFTDGTTTHPSDVLRRLVVPFGDSSVGCVSGRAVFRDDGSLTSKGLQVKQVYDSIIRRSLTRARTLFGATGCVYAVRRSLYVPLRSDLISDFVEPLKLLAAGYRTVYVPSAIGFVDRRPPDPRQEFERRSRMVLRGFRGILHMWYLLSPRRDLLQAISLASQRPLKWLTPFYALGVLVSSVALSHLPSVRTFCFIQLAFYVIGFLGWLFERRGLRVPHALALPLYFCIMCLAALAGIARLLRGDTGMTWETVGRVTE